MAKTGVAFGWAAEADAAAIAALRTAVSAKLAADYGCRASATTDKGVLFDLRHARLLVARRKGEIVATLSLQKKKPWAIDAACFAKAQKPLYLVSMAVAPALQRKGIGRRLIEAAVAEARALACDAIRLDAYDAPWGAGPFYEKCGFRECGRATYRGAGLVYYETMLCL